MLKHLTVAIGLAYISMSATQHAFAAEVSTDNKPQSLIETYHQALLHDPTLASALSANQAAQEIIEQGKALYRPTVNFNADANAVKKMCIRDRVSIDQSKARLLGVSSVDIANMLNGAMSCLLYTSRCV